MSKENKILAAVIITGTFVAALAAMSVHQMYIAKHIKASSTAPKA